MKMRKEAYERAGFEARSAGLSRKDNPYAPPRALATRGSADAETLRVLAEHWWRGWDSNQCGRSRRSSHEAGASKQG